MSSSITVESTGPLSESGPLRPPFSLVIAAFAAVYLIWGSTYLGMRLAIDSIPPLLMAGTRFMIAGAVLYLVMRLRGETKPDFGHWKSSVIAGALLLMGGNGGVVWAQMTVPSGVVALVVASVPLWIMLVDWLRPDGLRPTRRILLGLIIGMTGVAVIVMGRGALGQRMIDPFAATVLVLGNISWACGSIYIRHARKPASALLSVAMQMFCGGFLQFLLGLCLGEAQDFQFSAITATSAWAFVYLTLIGSLVGYTAYIWLLQVSTPARVSTHAYVNPFVAVLLGWWVLNEAIPQSVIIAGALILFSVILITRSSRSPK
jgi:drug/metabolite transporter (DMT)-like permease